MKKLLERYKKSVLSHLFKRHKESTKEKMRKSQRARFDKVKKEGVLI